MNKYRHVCSITPTLIKQNILMYIMVIADVCCVLPNYKIFSIIWLTVSLYIKQCAIN